MSAHEPSFLDAWRTLPEELKLHILNRVLAPEPSETSRGLVAYHDIKEARYWNQYPFLDLTLPLLECTEIKPLVLEAFYTQNTFLLDYGSSSFNVIHRPPGKIAAFVRRLRMRLRLWTKEGLQFLERVATETNKLEQLCSVDLVFASPWGLIWHSDSSTHRKQKAMEYSNSLDGMARVCFKCRCLRITHENNSIGRDDPLLLDKLTLHPEMGDTQTAWTRPARIHDRSFENDGIEDAGTSDQPSMHWMWWTVKEVATQEHYRLRPYTRYDKKSGGLV